MLPNKEKLKNSGVDPRSKGILVFSISRSIKEIEFVCDRLIVLKPRLAIPFTETKEIHTNILVTWKLAVYECQLGQTVGLQW